MQLSKKLSDFHVSGLPEQPGFVKLTISAEQQQQFNCVLAAEQAIEIGTILATVGESEQKRRGQP